MKKIIITVLMMMVLFSLTACEDAKSNKTFTSIEVEDAKSNKTFASVEVEDAKSNKTFASVEVEDAKSNKTFANAEVGDIISLGHYNQDNNTGNGVDEIEWIVLAIQDNKALVVSKLALDCQAYHRSYSDVSWEESSLRSWLNNTFYSTAFSDEEQQYISSVNLLDEDRNHGNMNTSEPIFDNIFLLSVTEAETYFVSNSDRICLPSAYTAEQNGGNPTKPCIWWLRTKGDLGVRATYVDETGSTSTAGVDLNASFGHTYKGNFCHNDAAVRPAMWIYIK